MNVLSIARRELTRRRRGVLVNLLLVLCVMSILVAVWTLREATMQRVRRVMAQMGNNLLFVPQDASVANYYSAAGVQATMPQERARFLATECPVTSEHATHYVAKFQDRIEVNGGEVILTGFDVIAGGHRPGEPRRRRSFLDDPLPAGQVLFGHEAARRAGVSAGDAVTLAGGRFTVARVLPEFGVLDDARVWARLEEVQALYHAEGRIHGVDALGCFCGGPYLEQIRNETAERVPEVRMVHSEVIARTRINSRVAVEGVGAIVLGIVAVLGAVAVFATTAGEVRERRGEIGILQAMGAGRERVLLLLMPKLLIVGLVGGLAGWAAGSVLGVWVGPLFGDGLEDVKFRVLFDLAPVAAGIGTVFAALAGGAAAWRACRMDPADALREL